jgi:hypothetical protein
MRHLHSSHSRLNAFIAMLTTRSVDGLLHGIIRKYTENNGNTRF